MNSIKKNYINNNIISYDCEDFFCGGKIIHLSFITPRRFLERILFRKSHPNRIELDAFIINLRKYCKKLIITDYRYAGREIQADLTIGFGVGFHASSKFRRFSIYYATGSAYDFQIRAVLNEIKYLEDKISIQTKNYFRLPEFEGTDIECSANKIYLIGNSNTLKTFGDNSAKVSLLPGIALHNSRFDLNIRRGVVFRDKILWMGSKGFLHKGLHIAAEVAFKLNLKLIIVGLRQNEKKYALEILRCIKCEFVIHEWVDINSEEWLSIVNDVTFCIGCSVSEGMSTSLLTCCYFGLIPISTDTCGINEGYVIPFMPRVDLVERMANAVFQYMSMNDVELNETKISLISSARLSYCFNSFSEGLNRHFESDLIN